VKELFFQHRRRWPWVRTLLAWLLGILLLVAVIASLDVGATLAKAAKANTSLVVLAVAGLTAIQVIGGVAWREIGRLIVGVALPLATALASYFVAQGLGALTPGNVGGDAYRIYVHRVAAQGWTNSAVPVYIQRATSFLALATYGVLGLALLPQAGTIGSSLLLGTSVFAALLGVAVLVLLRRQAVVLAGLPRILLLRAFAVGLASGLLFHGLAVALYSVLVVAVDPAAVSGPVLGAIAVARLATTLPFTPSGLGFQEGALAALFAGLGLDPATGVAASLLGRLAMLTTTAMGIGVIISRGKRG
jgi:uncharacterized membrane protein YbhN (UPF0104 family)